MEMALWSTIALVAALSMGSLFLLVSRIDGLGTSIDGLGARIDGLSARIDGFSARVDTRLDALGTRIDGVSADSSSRLDALSAAMVAGFDHVDERFDRVEGELRSHIARDAG